MNLEKRLNNLQSNIYEKINNEINKNEVKSQEKIVVNNEIEF